MRTISIISEYNIMVPHNKGRTEGKHGVPSLNFIAHLHRLVNDKDILFYQCAFLRVDLILYHKSCFLSIDLARFPVSQVLPSKGQLWPSDDLNRAPSLEMFQSIQSSLS